MMILLAKRNCHQIYTDSTLNSAYNVHLNIYQNFLITAMKMYSYLRHLGRSFRRNATFLIGECSISAPHTQLALTGSLAAIDKIITSTWSGLRRRLDMEEEDERSRRKAITW
ncbi:hypothetical protein SISNIDRAFT_455801 [Sistotremastrum niveocremeum HHB9708]|uniref:Telomerase reverse transcriptase n=2 Tax=Sistotremastraceae TaxID=3402574 RepID=A0A164TR81_9AGAM|nr:hypothetical protein SISNIDRAFT_455801 [Sistotremastrum niveocremeum HHB9708]KZT42239.1 hypothetical protein SISSUDRAFT_1041876 [Sistotremastrum suecicum HHB10207 ss-3]